MSYEMIDRFLRNNLGDEDYAEYSAALDALYTPQRKPLMDEQIWDAYMEIPAELDCNLVDLVDFARAIEAAHGIKGDA